MAVGLNASLTTYVSQSVISSSAANTNQANLNGAANPEFTTLIVDNNATLGNVVIGTGGNIFPVQSGGARNWTIYGWNGTSLASAIQVNNDGSITGNVGTSYSGLSRFTGAATGTYNHNLGATPSWCGPVQSTSGSSTYGFDSATSSQVHITSAGGASFACLCIKI